MRNRLEIGLVIAFLIGLIAWTIMGNYVQGLVKEIREKGVEYAQEE